jgi:glycosyltransferase involved in cell wall biosynthesis
VTTRVSVLPLLVTPDCGLLVDDVGARPLAAAIRTCLIDPERYRSMSATAWERAQQYSLEHWRDTIGRSLSAAWGPLSPDRPASGL